MHYVYYCSQNVVHHSNNDVKGEIGFIENRDRHTFIPAYFTFVVFGIFLCFVKNIKDTMYFQQN